MRSVLLVGLGKIAVGYDLTDSSAHSVLSHARAFSEHRGFQLVAGVDPCIDARKRFTDHYSVQSFSEIDKAFSALSPAVVVVATPTAVHLKTIKAIFAAGTPKAIMCEKPLAYSLDHAQQIANLCDKNNCALYVNFFRQAEPGVAEIRKRLASQQIMGPLKGVVWYSKGIFNSGSHFIDLLSNLMGDVVKVKVIDPGRLWQGSDPEPDVEITFALGRVIFLAARVEDFFHNSVEIIASNGVLRYALGGAQITWQPIEKTPQSEGNINLSSYIETLPTDFKRAQLHVVEQLFTAMDGHAAQISTGAQAVHTQKILEKIKESV